jgi:hypothetical protein
MKRCPKGSRRDKNGNCVKISMDELIVEMYKRKSSSKEMEPEPKNVTKRCLKGYCVKSDNRNTKKKRVSSEKERSSSGAKKRVSSEKERRSSSAKKITSSEKERRSSSAKKITSSEKERRSSSAKKITSSEKERRSSSETKTPRSMYAKRYFANNKNTIHLLDKVGDYDYVIFQVNYNDVSQFTEYQNLSIEIPRIDCVFQSIFSLGLRDVNLSKQDSLNVNAYGRGGVPSYELIKYIKNAFNLTPRSVVTTKDISIADDDDNDEHYNEDGVYDYNLFLDETLSQDDKNDKITTFFNHRIKNGYATTIAIKILGRSVEYGHRIVLYKHDNQIYFFDPQRKKYGEYVVHDRNQVYYVNTEGERVVYISTNLYDLIPRGMVLTNVNYIAITNLSSPKPLVDTSCPLLHRG